MTKKYEVRKSVLFLVATLQGLAIDFALTGEKSYIKTAYNSRTNSFYVDIFDRKNHAVISRSILLHEKYAEDSLLTLIKLIKDMREQKEGETDDREITEDFG